MISNIIHFFRKIIGTYQLEHKINNIEIILKKYYQAESKPNRESHDELEILPGTNYSRYLIPLDYPPSRLFSPRYGESHPFINEIADWFTAHEKIYIDFLSSINPADYENIPVTLQFDSLRPAWIGGPISAFDSMALYTMVKRYKPKIYLEIGSGMTTCFAKQAILDNNLLTKIISIDPQPRKEIDDICDLIIRDGLETCDISIFDSLQEGDILFFDGSHRTFMNSDVTVFFIDVLPRIKPGVVIHLHDILLPWDYPESFKYWYWNEQYMLAVYLMSKKDYLFPILPTAWICRNQAFADYFRIPIVDLGSDELNKSWQGGGSIWFTKV